MQTELKLQTLVYKNRLYLLPVGMLGFFILPVITFFVYVSVTGSPNETAFMLSMLIFLPAMHVFIHFLSGLRFVPTGKALVTSGQITLKDKTYKWRDVKTLHFHYRGDRRWKAILPFMQWLKGYNRYHNLYWQFGINNEKLIDKIVINGEPIYFKIRNAGEKQKFFRLKEMANAAGVNVIEEKTEFSYNLFGRKLSHE
jgi:hypothetical protein